MLLDTDFINPFLAGTVEALKVVCNIDVMSAKPFVGGTIKQPDFQVGAILGITSATFSGTISLLFTDTSLMEIISAWLGEKVEKITSEHHDAAAELLNMIFGSAKVVWNEQGRSIEKAIPTVIVGTPLHIVHKYPVLVIPFKIQNGVFHVEICSQPTEMSKAS